MNASHASRVFELETDLLLKLCESIASPRSQTIYMLAKYGEWQQLLDLSVNPCNYDNHAAFADDYLVTSVMQKNPRLPLPIDKRQVAIDKFLESEKCCSEANHRLSEYQEGRLSAPLDVHRVIHYAREHIRSILGPLSRSKLDYVERHMRFGPGATTSLSGVVTQGAKYSERQLDVTPRLADFRTFCFPPSWRGSVKSIRIRESSKLTTVPKNAKTDRVICIEPDLNIFVQLGIGALLREQLRLSGLDLSTQRTNQDAASRAYMDGLCTMDLSSASDTISREAVWLLIDHSWCDLLHMARVDKTELDGTEIPLSKWSSMGNGYTFELETLIFYGVLAGVRSVCGSESDFITAYGDDLIFPEPWTNLVARTLDFLGFKVNHGKTFGKGLFHESCGTDWFLGHNVRPFFFRSEYHDFESVCYLYANNLRRWAHRRAGGDSCDGRLFPVWFRCFTAVKRSDRHSIPEGFGDVGFSVDFDRASPSVRRLVPRKCDVFEYPNGHYLRGWSGFTFHYRSVKAQSRVISAEGTLLAFLNGNRTDFSLSRESLRGRYLAPKTKVGHVLDWPSLGPWVN